MEQEQPGPSSCSDEHIDTLSTVERESSSTSDEPDDTSLAVERESLPASDEPHDTSLTVEGELLLPTSNEPDETSLTVERESLPISNEHIDTSLTVGREFSSFEDLKAVLERRKFLFGDRWRIGSGCTSVSFANKQIQNPLRHYPEKLKYRFVKFRCIHNGHFTSKGSGKVKKSSYKIGCSAYFKVTACRKKQVLYILDIEQEHNHALITPEAGHYHEDRSATDVERAEIKRLQNLGVPCKKIMSTLLEETGKRFKRYDINNIGAYTGKTGVAKENYSLESILFFLKNAHLTHPRYIREAKAANISHIRFPDRKKLLTILNGESDTSASIDKSAYQKICARPTKIKRSAEAGSRDSKKKKSRMEMKKENSPSRVVLIRSLPNDASEADVVQLGLPFGKMSNIMLMRQENLAFLEFVEESCAIDMVSYYKTNPATIRTKSCYVQFSNHYVLRNAQKSAEEFVVEVLDKIPCTEELKATEVFQIQIDEGNNDDCEKSDFKPAIPSCGTYTIKSDIEMLNSLNEMEAYFLHHNASSEHLSSLGHVRDFIIRQASASLKKIAPQ